MSGTLPQLFYKIGYIPPFIPDLFSPSFLSLFSLRPNDVRGSQAAATERASAVTIPLTSRPFSEPEIYRAELNGGCFKQAPVDLNQASRRRRRLREKPQGSLLTSVRPLRQAGRSAGRAWTEAAAPAEPHHPSSASAASKISSPPSDTDYCLTLHMDADGATGHPLPRLNQRVLNHKPLTALSLWTPRRMGAACTPASGVQVFP